ncbi:MAG: hypothetical protein V3T05_02930 [Myxococcota bacterium]
MSKRGERKVYDDVPEAGALLGEPVRELGGESMNRDEVERLEFSTKQHKRPKGMSRSRYLNSAPGTETQTLIAMVGFDRYTPRAMALWILALGLVLGAVGFALVWWLAS